MMKLEDRKAVLGITAGVGIFLLFLYAFDKKGSGVPAPAKSSVKPENIDIALTAYQDAIANNEDQATLIQLNQTLMKDYGVTVVYKQENNSYVVKDKTGKILKTA